MRLSGVQIKCILFIYLKLINFDDLKALYHVSYKFLSKKITNLKNREISIQNIIGEASLQ